MKKIAILVAAIAAAFGIKKLLGRKKEENFETEAEAAANNGYIPQTGA